MSSRESSLDPDVGLTNLRDAETSHSVFISNEQLLAESLSTAAPRLPDEPASEKTSRVADLIVISISKNIPSPSSGGRPTQIEWAIVRRMGDADTLARDYSDVS